MYAEMACQILPLREMLRALGGEFKIHRDCVLKDDEEVIVVDHHDGSFTYKLIAIRK